MTEFMESLIWADASSKIGSSLDMRVASSPPKIKIKRKEKRKLKSLSEHA
ncbi:hypothetical protein MmTuc01_1341 [Methanosarcina mazei Tuc01]|uniref:Uncharacterized protein n=1 Tax=Methanosarcina mazei Tuc01 TaxID=1236903 RepID=M1PWU2_METMZ|nr:hypothetical protein [Methanosarcina mazei]AGF96721.1 hypothetical protein MmTuc01_1341 [Methanosarcina mazei Tuc01]